MINAEIFKQYDVRGLVPDEFDLQSAFEIGRGFATILVAQDRGNVLVGCDNRIPIVQGAPASVELAEAFCQGLRHQGLNTGFLRSVPTPLVYYLSIARSFDAYGVITGSHNPREYNGIKMGTVNRSLVTLEPVFGEALQRLRGIVQSQDYSTTRQPGRELPIGDSTIAEYTTAMLGRLRRPDSAPHVVIDPGNAVAGLVAPGLLEQLGCRVECLNCNLDGEFPEHVPNPERPQNLNALRSRVVQMNADLGFAFDGDADRIGVVDERGEVIYPDVLLGLLAQNILPEYGAAGIVLDTLCSEGVAQYINGLGGQSIRSRTGYPSIREAIRQHQAVIGGEISGHIFFADRDLFGYDDALFAAGRIVELVSGGGRKISEMVADVPVWKQMRQKRIACDRTDEAVRAFDDLVRGYADDIRYQDGVEALFRQDGKVAGRIVVRPSSTEPVLSMMCEARAEPLLDTLRDFLLGSLSRLPGVSQ